MHQLSQRCFFVLIIGLLIGLTSCATPASRISESPELFASFPPEVQELIKQGKVGIGFDASMVRLAVGEPDRKWDRTDSEGKSEIWAFTRFEAVDGLPLYRGGYHRAYEGYYPHYEMYPARKARDYFRVIFKAGKVIAVESDSLKNF